MIAEEFLGIAAAALRTYRGADSVTVSAVEPSRHGPLVRWSAPLLAVERERRDDGGSQFVGPVPGRRPKPELPSPRPPSGSHDPGTPEVSRPKDSRPPHPGGLFSGCS